MIDVKTYSVNLDAHITYLEKIYSNDELDKQEVKQIQRDLGYKLEKILQYYDAINNDDIKGLLTKIAKINKLMGNAK
ncbi:hypothetical protein J3T76_13040 [Staphylococcus nepalensis]|uniref:hypothetical protein n=1 Tax=Staphylococcus nepalensis TaxID=214473 RepID=UPI001A9A0AB7|nr:hypothetical protein [Staphylococcus nepalensis]MBO1207074.1 hypothetical protein [Staphylococcus nepalensis]